jgi:hypothetical protein
MGDERAPKIQVSILASQNGDQLNEPSGLVAFHRSIPFQLDFHSRNKLLSPGINWSEEQS